MAWGGTSGRMGAAGAAPQGLRPFSPQATHLAKPASVSGFPSAYVQPLPFVYQHLRRLRRVQGARVRAPFAHDPRGVANGTWGPTHPMTGTIFVTAVGGPANTCGKTRPL